MKDIILLAHNLRSTYNVGSLLRTADGIGLKEVWLTGYTPHPEIQNDKRLPHEIKKVTKQLSKTALGAEKTISISRYEDIFEAIKMLHIKGYTLCALEQTPNSVNVLDFQCPDKLVLIVGNELAGLESKVIDKCDKTVEIPMHGKKESFNVTVAAAMALFHLCNTI